MQVRGRYATALSATDIQQIQRLAQDSPHLGHTLFTLTALQSDRVHVQTREYKQHGWSGINVYVIRQHGRWQRDEQSPILGEAERTVTVY